MNNIKIMCTNTEPMYTAPVPELDGSVAYRLVRTADVADPALPDVWSIAVILATRSGYTESRFAYDVARSLADAESVAAALCSHRVLPDALFESLDAML